MEREKEFLTELSELSKKYNIIVDGCGCCGSPFLRPFRDCDDPNGYYGYEYGSGKLIWEKVNDLRRQDNNDKWDSGNDSLSFS